MSVPHTLLSLPPAGQVNFKVFPTSKGLRVGEVFHSTGVASSAARTTLSVFAVLKTKLCDHEP
jgi:hypothetical protein